MVSIFGMFYGIIAEILGVTMSVVIYNVTIPLLNILFAAGTTTNILLTFGVWMLIVILTFIIPALAVMGHIDGRKLLMRAFG